MSITAMKQALEALGSYMEATDSEADAEAHSLMAAAFFKLKEAVAEAEKQEPVAWLYRDSWGTLKLSQIMPPPIGAFPVYTTPPAAQPTPVSGNYVASPDKRWRIDPVTGNVGIGTPPAAQRQWAGLTDEEIIDVLHPLVMADMPDEATDYEIAKAIEAKLKEKNT